jgi:hypothetical protein
MDAVRTTHRRARAIALGVAAINLLALCAAPGALAASDTTQFSVVAGSLSFGTSPDVPNISTLTLNGQSQTLNAQMNPFSVVDATGSGSGWNVTVAGDSSASHSDVFAQYCPGPGACGGDPAGYVSGGASLAADSLTLSSTGAGFTAQNGTTGTAPTHQCGSGCFVDHASAVKVLSAASGAGMGTWQASSWGASSLALAAPTTVKALPASEVYHLDLVWTLNTGP